MKPASSDLSSRCSPDRGSAALGALAGLLLVACVFVALALPGSARSAEAVQTLLSADFVLSDTAFPPPADAPWRPQSLPDWWAQSRPDSPQTSGWYRLLFDVQQPAAGPRAVYMPRVRPA